MTDPRLARIILAVGGDGFCLSRPQRKCLELLFHLSSRVEFVKISGQSTYPPHSRRILVEVDGGRHVDLDVDGEMELLDDPPGFAAGGPVPDVHIHVQRSGLSDEQILDAIADRVSLRIGRKTSMLRARHHPV